MSRLAYHNDPSVKDKYVNRLAEHRRLEHLTQGVGWEHNGVTKGCAVGCTLEKYDHSLYPVELGLPEWLARLEDHLFEALPKGKAEQFAIDFLTAIPVGADIEPVRHRLAIVRQEAALERLKDNKEPYADQCRNAIGLVIAWHNSELINAGQESAAESAARSAAWSAESAARSAAWSAESAAQSAAWSAAWSAESAAWSAAWSAESAESAARPAARTNYYEWEAATLLRLLSEA
jgi:hypothetical protein